MECSFRVALIAVLKIIFNLKIGDKIQTKNETFKEVNNLVSHLWVQRFMDSCNTFPRSQTRKLMNSKVIQEHIHREAYHADVLSRLLQKK